VFYHKRHPLDGVAFVHFEVVESVFKSTHVQEAGGLSRIDRLRLAEYAVAGEIVDLEIDCALQFFTPLDIQLVAGGIRVDHRGRQGGEGDAGRPGTVIWGVCACRGAYAAHPGFVGTGGQQVANEADSGL